MGEKRRVVITHVHETELDADRIEEYVHATYTDGDQVQIQDIESGEMLYDNIGSDTL